ncbi:MAG: two-component regulator propeller domain-containing protein [Anaerolineae bacterium]
MVRHGRRRKPAAPDGTVIHYRSARGEVAGMVTGIAIDGAGNRWFGTYYSGLSVMRADGRWETFKAAAGGGLSYDLVIDVNVDRDGRVWVLSGGLPSPSAKAFEPAVDIVAPDGRWTALDVTGWVDIDDGLLRAVAFDARGEAWFAADNGILAPDGPGRWKRLPAADGPAAGGVSHVVFDAAGDLWAATGGGLSRRSPDGAWRTYRRGDLPTSNVNAIAVDAEGTAWLGTAGGGLVRRAPDGTWRAYTTDDGLIGNGVFSVAVDPTGGVWFSSGGTTDNEDEGGVHHLAADGRLTRFGRADGLPSSSVGDIVVDAEGNAWFATSTYFYGPNQRRDGRQARRAADGTWTSFSRDDGLPRGGDVRALALDADGGLWVGSDVNQGAPTENLSHRALDGVCERVPLPGAAASYYISALTFDHAGNLWVGNWDGVLRRAPDGRWTTRADDPALNFQASAIAVDAAGALWFSAAPGTVRVLHPDGAWETITEADGLAPATIEAIAVGLDGRMWFAGREGGVSILAPAADGRQP